MQFTPSFFISDQILSNSLITYKHDEAYLYDCVEVPKSLLDEQKQLFCGGLLKMIK